MNFSADAGHFHFFPPRNVFDKMLHQQQDQVIIVHGHQMIMTKIMMMVMMSLTR